MTSDEYRTMRLILRPPQGEGEVAEYAAEYGWLPDPELAENGGKGPHGELRWTMAPGVLMHYSVDEATNLPYIYFSAPMVNMGTALFRDAEEHLDTIPYGELLAKYEASSKPRDRARALLGLALGSPRQLDDNSLSRMTEALTDDSADVRKAAVRATAYTPSRRYRPYLREIAEKDSKKDIRKDAARMLEAYDAAGIGEA